MEVEIKIDRLGQQGHGVGRDADDNVYFVARSLPGDRVRVKPVKTHKRYKEAHLEKVLNASPDRVSPVCEYFQNCGGCDFLHFDYEKQLEFKEGIVTHSLNRNGIEVAVREPIIGAEKTLAYRNRVQFRKEGPRFGFYKPKSHELVDLKKCAVVDPRINEWLKKARAGEFHLGEGKIEVSINRDGEVEVSQDQPHSANGFAQIHCEQNKKLVDLVEAQVKECQSQQVLELFCGNGNLTERYGKHVKFVYGVDSNALAAASAAMLFPPDHAKFACKNVDKRLSSVLPSRIRKRYDTLIVDPPRRGVGGDVLSSFVHPGLKNVIYVSCSVRSFTFDAQALIGQGFSIQWMRAIDMFPHTKHVELIARFSRTS